MQHRLFTMWAGWWARISTAGRIRRVAGEERGEGVISTAIAVLIIALIGAAMWVTFNQVWSGAEERIQDSVNQIGG